MKYFIKKQLPKLKITAKKKCISSLSESEEVDLIKIEEIQGKYQNLSPKEHKDFVVEVADALSLNNKFKIEEIADFISDIYIEEREIFIRVITNK